MTEISKRLEQTFRSVITKNPILPIKVDGGILVGDVLIVSRDNLKDLYQNTDLIYADISLNLVAITLANLLAKRSRIEHADKIYRADQEYGRWYTDSQILRNQYEKAVNIRDFDRADMLWARYIESRNRAVFNKKQAETLLSI